MTAVDTRHLRYFVQVASDLNFTRAAKSLFVAQQTLSDAIAQLEKQVGASLLWRSKQRVGLTPAGEAFLAQAKLVLDDLDRGIGLARAAERATGRRVVVGTPDWPWGLHLFREGLAEARERDADLVIVVEPIPWIEHIASVLDGRLDVGVTLVSGPSDLPDGLEFVPLADEDSGWVLVREGHPLIDLPVPGAADVGRYPIQFIPRSPHPGLHDALRGHIAAAGVDVTSLPHFAGPMAAAIAQAGASETVVWVSGRQTIGAPSGLRSVRVPDLVLPVTFGAILRREASGDAVRAVVARIRATAGRMTGG